MHTPEGDIRFACTRFGARTVYDAANRRLAGDHRPLPFVGLTDAETFEEADRIVQISYRSMTVVERDAVIAEAAAALDMLPWH
jgi:hypothetical protein